MLFFQVVLLLGYLYAHWLHEKLAPRRQAAVHIAALAVSFAALPMLPNPGWKSAGVAHPSLTILALLSAHRGAALLPAFLHQPVVAGVVRADPPRGNAVSPVCPLELRLHAGAAELSLRSGAEPAGAHAGVGVVRRIRLLRGALWNHRVAIVPARRRAPNGGPGGRKNRGWRPHLDAASLVAGPGRRRFGSAACRHQSSHPGCRRHSVSVDPAAQRLPVELHRLFRISAVLPARRLSSAAGGGSGFHGIPALAVPHRIQSLLARLSHANAD